MADGQPQYEIKVVQAIRGTEARTIAKWQKDGWEITGQVPGTLRTEISMHRPKPNLHVRTLTIAGGVAAVLGLALVLLNVLGGDDEPTPAAETPVAAATAEETSAPVSQQTVPSTEAAPVALTPETNADLAALLAQRDSCDPSIPAFVEKYQGQQLTFPANIGYMQNHGGFETRYDILIVAGDYSETSAPGPAMQLRDKNTVSDLNLVGDVPDAIGVGTNLLVTVEAAEWEESSCLLLLEPVETAVR